MDPFQIWPLSMATHTKSIAGRHRWAMENPITAHDLKLVYMPTCDRQSRLKADSAHILNYGDVSQFCELATLFYVTADN